MCKIGLEHALLQVKNFDWKLHIHFVRNLFDIDHPVNVSHAKFQTVWEETVDNSLLHTVHGRVIPYPWDGLRLAAWIM